MSKVVICVFKIVSRSHIINFSCAEPLHCISVVYLLLETEEWMCRMAHVIEEMGVLYIPYIHLVSSVLLLMTIA